MERVVDTRPEGVSVVKEALVVDTWYPSAVKEGANESEERGGGKWRLNDSVYKKKNKKKKKEN